MEVKIKNLMDGYQELITINIIEAYDLPRVGDRLKVNELELFVKYVEWDYSGNNNTLISVSLIVEQWFI